MITSSDSTASVVRSFLSSLDCPRSLTVWLLFVNNEHDQLAALDFNPSNYEGLVAFRDAYFASCFLSKSNFLSTSVDKKSKALEKFQQSEVRCAEVNKDAFKSAYLKHKHFEWVHNGSRRKIERILGEFSDEELYDLSNWGPGVTQILKRDTSSTNKFRSENGISQHLHDFIGKNAELAYPTWKIKKFTFQSGNKIVTVPKNSKTDRTIAIEPGLNLWFQKGAGSMIRRRLFRAGLDLNSQTRNQRLAKVGSETNNLATVDFSNASDSISISTVEELLPPVWYTFLNALRSKFGFLDGRQFWYEKFSSMGNGFTFELESLIFYAIALSCCDKLGVSTKNVSVYGDDVIIPIEAYQLFLEITAIYGFTVNTEKSFTSGPFRESCGSHYYKGIDCKPYYLKRSIKGESDLYLAGNSVRRLAKTINFYGCDERFSDCWHNIFKKVDPTRRCLISDGYGDGGFIVNFDEATPSKARFGIEGYYSKSLITVPKGYYSDDHALLLARLKGCGGEISFGNKTFLKSRVKVLRKKILIRQWADLGPWL